MTQVEPLASAITTVFSNVANNVVSQLAAACAATDTSISLLTGTGAAFPAAPFYCSIEYEVLWCSSKTGDVFSVQRGVDGTTAASHVINSIVQIRNNAGLFHDAYAAIQEVDSGVTSGSALPADIAYTDKTQTFTNKTIDVSNPSTGNVIIGTVQPDPAALVYTNTLDNGGFDLWTASPSLTLAAGSPTSGGRAGYGPCNFWNTYGVNDSAITVARDTANIDPGFPSGYDALVNISTVQANDYVSMYQQIERSTLANIDAMVGSPYSVSARIKLLSGSGISVALSFGFFDSTGQPHTVISAYQPVTGSGYATYKFENQIWVGAVGAIYITFAIQFKGVGQVAVDNIMITRSTVAATYYPKPLPVINTTNLLTNGGFEIWQRGNGPFSTSGQITADRWMLGLGTSSSTSVSKGFAGATGSYGGTSNCALVTNTQGSSNSYLIQTIKISDFEELRGRYVSFTVRMDEPVANGCYITLSCDGTGGMSLNTTPLATPNGWFTQALTIGPIPNDATYVQAAIWFQASGNFYVDNAMLVLGQIPSEYVPVHPADDLVRCQRYYEAYSFSSNTYIANGQTYIANGAVACFKVGAKAVNPSITFSAPSTFAMTGNSFGLNPLTGISANSNNINTTGPGVLGLGVNIAGSTQTPGWATTILANTSNTATIVLEANP